MLGSLVAPVEGYKRSEHILKYAWILNAMLNCTESIQVGTNGQGAFETCCFFCFVCLFSISHTVLQGICWGKHSWEGWDWANTQQTSKLLKLLLVQRCSHWSVKQMHLITLLTFGTRVGSNHNIPMTCISHFQMNYLESLIPRDQGHYSPLTLFSRLKDRTLYSFFFSS